MYDTSVGFNFRNNFANLGSFAKADRWAYTERLYEGPELFDRATDPRETVNLAGSEATIEVERDLKDRIFRWLFETSDVIPWAPDPRMEPALRAELLGEQR